MKPKPLLLSSLAALVACASPGTRPDPSVTEAARGSLAMEVVAWSPATGPRPLIPGSALRSSDRFSITVVSSQPLFLYIGQRPAGGAPSILLPARGAQAPRTEPERPLRLPGDERQGFQLDGQAADETLYVLASTRQLDPDRATRLLSERAAAEAPLATREGAPAGSSRRSSEDDSTLLREPPPTLGDTRRGPSRDASETPESGRVRSQVGDDGLALLSFPLHHEP
jgi:hypothetical protein